MSSAAPDTRSTSGTGPPASQGSSTPSRPQTQLEGSSPAPTAGSDTDSPTKSNRARALCQRCGGRTTVGVVTRFGGVCSNCQAWTRRTFQETLADLPEEVEELVRNAILDKASLDLAASSLKKDWPLKHPNREWDAPLVILVDERRRARVNKR